jgi:hypothetical protein
MQSRQPREPLRPASFLSWLSQVLALALLLAVQGPALALDETKPGAAEPAPLGDVVTVPIGYLEQEVKRPLPISRLNIPPDDLGVAGAELALKDNNTTGRFTKQQFTLDVVRVPVGDDAVAALEKLVESGHHFILVDAPAKTLLILADAAKGVEEMDALARREGDPPGRPRLFGGSRAGGAALRWEDRRGARI